MGKVQSRITEKLNNVFSEDRKAELKRGVSYFNERACIFKEITLLTKHDLQCAVSDMNVMLGKSCRSSINRVVFHCKIDGGLYWKAKSRIFCFQVDSNTQDATVTRYMNIVQFWTLRSEILKRVGKRYGKEEENQFEFVYFSGNVVDSEEINTAEQTDVQDETLSTTEVFDRVNELSSEEIECCICMERKSDVSLICAHCFCKHCIESWQQHEQKTCPLCRETISEGDEYWELTDVPDKDEMHNYVVSLASGIPSLPT